MAPGPPRLRSGRGAVGGVVNPGEISDTNMTMSPDIHPPFVMPSCPAIAATSSVRRPLPNDDSDVDFQPVTNKRTQRAQKKTKGKDTHVTHGSLRVPVPASDVESTDGQTIRPLQPIPVTNESTCYAQTRYPFSPFALRFNSGKISVNQVKECLVDHCSVNHQTSLSIINCRLPKRFVANQPYDMLIYVKDVFLFSFPLNPVHWPSQIGGESFSLSSSPPIPPHLCLLIKDVDLRIDLNEFTADLRKKYPDVKNIIRMKNKFQNEIKLIKLELTSSVVRDKLVDEKRIHVNYITYDVVEYLAPANVLICSKCMGMGHFKKQCTQVKETCRTCAELVDAMKNHVCSKVEKCIHCDQNHKSNSLKCSVIKSFRAELTRKILNIQPPVNPLMNKGFSFIPSVFPPLPAPQSSTGSLSLVLNKLDELSGKLSAVNNQLAVLEEKHDRFEQFIVSKNLSDDSIKSELLNLSDDYEKTKNDVTHCGMSIDRHGNLLIKLLLPLLDDVCKSLSSLNMGEKSRVLDADLKGRLDRNRTQLKKAKEGKQFTN